MAQILIMLLIMTRKAFMPDGDDLRLSYDDTRLRNKYLRGFFIIYSVKAHVDLTADCSLRELIFV